MKILFLIATLFIMMSCQQAQTIKVSAIENAAKIGTKIIEVGLSPCTHPEEIEKDILQEFQSLKWLKYTYNQKSVGGDLCATAFAGIIPKFVDYGTGKVPERWGCTGQDIKELGVKFAEAICSKI